MATSSPLKSEAIATPNVAPSEVFRVIFAIKSMKIVTDAAKVEISAQYQINAFDVITAVEKKIETKIS